MDFSIIVPVYNVEKYVTRCLDSIFTQQFSGTFEVIAVDDGSTDNSLQMLKNYHKKESRLKILEHGINKKLSIARTTGMNASNGDYILHVDSDDWMLPGSLEEILLKCKSSDADVVVFDFLREDNSGRQLFENEIREELFTKDKLKVQKHFFGSPWNKVVKRRLTENMIYGTIGINSVEDLIYSTEILLRADSILLVNKVLYAYFLNQSSLTQTVNLKALLDNQKVIYSELQKILNANSYKPEFKRKLLAQRENVIYDLLLANHRSEKEAKASTEDLVKHLHLFYSSNDKRMSRMIKATESKYFCMLQYFLSLGIVNSLSILMRKIVPIEKTLNKFGSPYFDHNLVKK